jgi:hypothetical protein
MLFRSIARNAFQHTPPVASVSRRSAADVHFAPKADMQLGIRRYPLSANFGLAHCKALLFDDLVGTDERLSRHLYAKRFCGSQVG